MLLLTNLLLESLSLVCFTLSNTDEPLADLLTGFLEERVVLGMRVRCSPTDSGFLSPCLELRSDERVALNERVLFGKPESPLDRESLFDNESVFSDGLKMLRVATLVWLITQTLYTMQHTGLKLKCATKPLHIVQTHLITPHSTRQYTC